MSPAAVSEGTNSRSREDLIREIDDLKRYERIFRTVVEGSLDAMLVVDTDGAILYVNPAAERMFELPGPEMIGAVFGFPITLAEPVEMYVLQRSRKFVAVEMWIVRIQWKDSPACLVSLRDITRIVRTTEELSRYKDQLEQAVRYRTQDLASAFVKMQAETNAHRRAEEALRRSEEQFRVLAETAHAGIVLFRGDRFIYVNPAMEKALGYTKDELLAMNYWDIVHPDSRHLVRSVASARQSGLNVPSTYEFKYVTKGGETRWVEMSAAMIDYIGQKTGIGTVFDVTERKRAEEAREEAKARAELYLDLMSHDIDNMNQIGIGYLELALEPGGTGLEEREFLQQALDTLLNSSKLIDNVRKLQRVKTGKLLHYPVDAGDIISRIKREYVSAFGRHIAINLTRCDRCAVDANDLLHDVFSNLVGHAIRRSAAPLTIGIDVSDVREDGRRYCRISLEDDGPGIPPGMRDALFTRFLHGAKAHGKDLGLYLAKTLIDGFGGSIRVEDRVPGDYRQGTRFVVTLPAIEK